MSHAREGININLFHKPIFNFAFSANDLFSYYHLVKKLKCENAGIVNTKYCILELPYYIFNWDRSRSRDAFMYMNVYSILGKYHHLDTREGGLIKEYHTFEDMFKRKKMYNDSVYNIGIYYEKLDKIADIDFAEISHIWKMEYEDTIRENIEYFKELVSLLYGINRNMKIYVIVFPQNPRFYKLHKEMIDNAKDKFYKIMDNIILKNVILLDYFEYYDKMEHYFSDHCHLNTSGRNAFTETIVHYIEES